VDVIGTGLRRMYAADASANAFDDLLKQIDDADQRMRVGPLQKPRLLQAG
jgi:hypothetical protein